MFQWLRLWASTAGHLLSIPSSGTKITQAVWLGPPPENWFKTRFWGTFLAVQWLRLHLPMQEVPVQSLMQRTCDQRNKSIKQKQYYNKFNKDFFFKKYVKQQILNGPQQQQHLEPVLHNKSHHSEKARTPHQRGNPAFCLYAATTTQHSQ